MRINPQALERLRAAPLHGAGFADICENMLLAASATDATPVFNLDYQPTPEEIEEGDLIPVITIYLRQAK